MFCLTAPDQAEEYTVDERDLLSGHPSYPEWLRRVEAVFQRMQAEHPQVERRPYQIENAAMYCLRRRNLMGHAQGSGKTTTTALMIAALYPRLEEARPGLVLVVAPSALSASTRWLPDLERVPALQGQVALITRETKHLPDAPIWVVTCDFPRNRSRYLKHREQPHRRTMARRLGKKHAPALLVLDEVHLFQGKTLRTQAIRYLCQRSRRILGLSGTLSDGRLDLIHTTASLLYGQRWPFTQREFLDRYANKQAVQSRYLQTEEEELKPSPRYLQHLSLYKLGEYHALSRRYIHRLTLNDPSVASCVRRPEQSMKVHVAQPSQEHSELYRSVVQEHLEQLRTLAALPHAGTPGRFPLIWELFAVANHPWSKGLQEPPAKAMDLLELLKDCPKTVVFTNSVPAARWLHHFLRSHMSPEQVIRLYAEDNQETPPRLNDDQREQALSRYCFDPEVRAGIFSLRLASLSIDMLTTEQVVFWDLPWQALPVQQAITRVVRPGNPISNVPIHMLTTDGMLDWHAFSLLSQRILNARLLLDYDLESLHDLEIGELDAGDLARRILVT